METFVGGAGNDTYPGSPGPDTIDGGAGVDSLIGGAGNDSFISSSGADIMIGGAGDDTFRLRHAHWITGGEGRDTYRFGDDYISWHGGPPGYDFSAGTVITDFDVSLGGDILDISGLFTREGRVGPATYARTASNPFATGEARLLDTPEGVQLQINLGGEVWKPLVVLFGVKANQLEARHFAPGTSVTPNGNMADGYSGTTTTTVVIDPRNTPPPGQVIDGTSGSETLTGGAGNDSMRGFDGNDSVIGGVGDDDVNGNQGVDTVSGGTGADWVRGGQGHDWIRGGDGNDPHVNGNLGDDDVAGDLGNDSVYGGQGSDTLWGGEGDDFLSGDLGNDVLLGQAGADRFSLRPDGGRDWVMDFNASEGDRIALPAGHAYTVSSVNGEVVIELTGGAGLGLAHVAPSAFSTSYIVFV